VSTTPAPVLIDSYRPQRPSAETAITDLAVRLVQQITAQVRTELAAAAVRQLPAQGRLLTAKQAAEYISRSEQAVRHLIFQRDIPVVRNGRNVRIDRKDLDIWIERNKC
jgi:excisionase family DNA binding protein